MATTRRKEAEGRDGPVRAGAGRTGTSGVVLQVAELAVYEFDSYSNEMLADVLGHISAREHSPEVVARVLGEAARRLRAMPDVPLVPAKFEVSVDGGEWAELADDIPIWVRDALSSPYRTSVSATHQNGLTYRFRRTGDR